MNKVTDVAVSQNSVISLHVQLHNQLRQLILSGRWANATLIPSESQFAEHLRVSRSTVRLALQQAEIEGLIERIAGRGTFVSYAPTTERESRLIGFVTCDFDAENHLLILNGAEREVRARGYQIIFNCAKNYQDEIEILKQLKEENAAGVVMWPNAADSRAQPRNKGGYWRPDFPIVAMDRTIYGLECDCVTSDNYGGAQALMHYLVELGHRRVVFLSHHELQLFPVMERYRAYCDVLREANLEPVEPWLIGQAGKEISAGQTLRLSVDNKSPELHHFKDYMARTQPPPTAIFAVNDYIAIIAMRAMKVLGLRVPDAVSIAGFDDTNLSAHLEIPLTTVAQDSFNIGRRATQILIDRIEGYSGPFDCIFLPTQLRIRSSTAVPVNA